MGEHYPLTRPSVGADTSKRKGGHRSIFSKAYLGRFPDRERLQGKTTGLAPFAGGVPPYPPPLFDLLIYRVLDQEVYSRYSRVEEAIQLDRNLWV